MRFHDNCDIIGTESNYSQFWGDDSVDEHADPRFHPSDKQSRPKRIPLKDPALNDTHENLESTMFQKTVHIVIQKMDKADKASRGI